MTDEEAETLAVWRILDANPHLCVRNWMSSTRDKRPPTFVVSSVRHQQQPVANQSGDEQSRQRPTLQAAALIVAAAAT